jgi:hypothetical protein
MVVVVYINGFLAPQQDLLAAVEVFAGARVIQVSPSNVSSLHDRVMQIFFELKGGYVHYGEQHAKFHGHSPVGEEQFVGLYREWDEDHPVHLVGHSFGGLTARVMEHYLADGDMFEGHRTNAGWIRSLTTISAPLNGGLMVYPLGAHTGMPPVVRVASVGYCVSFMVHIIEYFDIRSLKKLYDFKMSHWKLKHCHKNAFYSLLRVCLGICVHSTTDNSAYDMTWHAQLKWNRYLTTTPNTYYLSVAGTNCYSPTSLFLHRLFYFARIFVVRSIPKLLVCADHLGMRRFQTAELGLNEFDGMLFYNEQSFPSLRKHKDGTVTDHEFIKCLSDVSQIVQGKWYIYRRDMDHVGVMSDPKVWVLVMEAIKQFDSLAQSNPCKRMSTSSHHDTRDTHMQTVQWAGKQPSDIHTSLHYKLAVLLIEIIVVWYILTYSPVTLCAALSGGAGTAMMASLVPLVVHLSSQSFLHLSSDALGLWFSCLRCLMCVHMMRVHSIPPSDFVVLGGTYLAEVGSCYAMRVVIYDYSTPLSKLFLAFTTAHIAVISNDLLPLTLSRYVFTVSLINCLYVVAWSCWRFAESSVNASLGKHRQLKMTITALLWSIFFIVGGCVMCLQQRISDECAVHMLAARRVFRLYQLCSVWMIFQCFRNVSEAYQVICMKNGWLFSASHWDAAENNSS